MSGSRSESIDMQCPMCGAQVEVLGNADGTVARKCTDCSWGRSLRAADFKLDPNRDTLVCGMQVFGVKRKPGFKHGKCDACGSPIWISQRARLGVSGKPQIICKPCDDGIHPDGPPEDAEHL